MIECYTLLAALSQRTSRVRLSALVTGNTYRHPSLLAKIRDHMTDKIKDFSKDWVLEHE